MSFTLIFENLRCNGRAATAKAFKSLDRIVDLCASGCNPGADAHADACAQSERFPGRGDNCPHF